MKQPISSRGYDDLMSELRDLKEVDRPAILVAINEARKHGDLSENAEYASAREKQRHIDRRIIFLESIISNAQVIDIDSMSGDRAVFGAFVTVEDEDGNRMQCQLLSEIEADGKQRIACTSPFGRAMLGKCKGDSCTVKTPSGDREYEVIEVRFRK